MKINVLGSGHMGKQICSLFVVIGHNVKIWQNSLQNHEKLIQKEIIKIEKHFKIKAKGNNKNINCVKLLKPVYFIDNSINIKRKKQ